MRKSSILFIILPLLFLFGVSFVHASDSLNAYFFYGDGCPHCAKEQVYLQNIQEKYPDLEIKSFEVYHNQNNSLLLQKTAQTLDVNVGGVPFLVIGDKHFIGYADSITPRGIEKRIDECLKNNCPDSIAKILGIEVGEKQNLTEKPIETEVVEDIAEEQNEVENKEEIIKLPIFGEINIYRSSLPVFTIFMGVLDGFNPCAMWALLFLISLLLGMKDRKRMWILGTVFIVASALVYFIFMSAWLNLMLFLGLIIWVRIIIGILALLGGGYSIKEFLLNKDSGCKVLGDEKHQKIFQKLKLVIGQNSFWLALTGIVTLAFMVNLVELICSAGLPAIYTQVLALNDLSQWQYYLYILLYIFFFMLDDLFVFFIAMITLEMTGVTTKYVKYSRLIGGILMLIIGTLLIFKPQLLMFG